MSAALADKVRSDRRLEDHQAAITDYEAEFEEITAGDIATQRRADREDAVVLRGRGSGASGRGGGARKAKSP